LISVLSSLATMVVNSNTRSSTRKRRPAGGGGGGGGQTQNIRQQVSSLPSSVDQEKVDEKSIKRATEIDDHVSLNRSNRVDLLSLLLIIIRL
jgi:hypothetical protein